MQILNDLLNEFDSILWGPLLIVLIIGTGLYLTIGLRGLSILEIPRGFRLLWIGRKKKDDVVGELSPFQSLMTALAATVGTGNIAGVATAIYTGGPGALFWMWCTALVGMATKYAETVLACQYREVTPAGNVVGGPMYFIKNGLGAKWKWLATLFAIFGGFAGFGIGNMTQANSIADGLHHAFGLPVEVSAVIMFLVLGMVVLGGVSRIGAVASLIVPAMAVVYIFFALIIVFMHFGEIPAMLSLIFKDAFTPAAAQGGFAGATVMMAVRYGVARGIFSNEAGLGSAAMAHATATVANPVKMGIIGMLGTFIDTIIVCSMTGFAILATGVWDCGVSGAPLTSKAFETAMPSIGAPVVAICLALFAFTTILGWCVYSERCWIYLCGDKALKPFRFIFCCLAPVGACITLDMAWTCADIMNALMAFPNLIALVLLSPVVFKVTNEYRKSDNKDVLHD